jgi:membrane-associated protein
VTSEPATHALTEKVHAAAQHDLGGGDHARGRSLAGRLDGERDARVGRRPRRGRDLGTASSAVTIATCARPGLGALVAGGHGAFARCFGQCDDQRTLVHPAAALTARFVPAAVAIAGIGLAVAIAAGAVAVPDLAGAFSDASHSLGGWIYPAVVALLFLETTALVGFVIHGELVLLVAGVAAERGDASLVLLVALAAAAAVAGDVVSFLLGRRLGRPFIELHGVRVRIGAAQLARVDGFFARHGGKAVVLGRFTGFLRATLPFVAGSSGMALRRLVPFSALSAIAWTVAFTVIGYAFSASAARAGACATRVALVTVLLATAGFIVRSRRTRGREDRVAAQAGP